MQKCAIGIDIGGTKTDISLIFDNGDIKEKIIIDTPIDYPEALIAIIANCNILIKKFSPVGIGMGMAGQIEAETGNLLYAPNLGWKDVPLKKALSTALQIPVVITNDVRAATWAELYLGAGKGESDLVCIFVGTGIGGGIVSKGKILNGFSNTGGEIGHMTVHIGGRKCNCGNEGCWEAYAGGWSIAEQGKEAVMKFPLQGNSILQLSNGCIDSITAKNVIKAAQESDPLAKQIIDVVLRAMIAGTTTIINVLNPKKIIFGGGIIGGMPDIVAHIDSEVRKHALPAATKGLEITAAKLKESAGVIGAALMTINQQI